MVANKQFDYIIVGAGSAGAVVAGRLSEDPGISVLLLEAGPSDDSYWSRLPLGFGKILFNPKYMWTHQTIAEPYLNNRKVGLPHGKLLGGSSAINGLVFVRGFPLDYNTWAAMGANGWSYDEVLPYFRKLERNQHGANKFRGDKGPIGVEDVRWRSPLADAAFKGMRELGIPAVEDFAAANSEGAGYWQLNTWKGWRSSASTGYIRPNRHRPNLTVATGAFASRILFEGKRAIGVEYTQNGTAQTARAGREVILSAGALQSPQLLQVSGVGPAALLRSHGIDVVHDLPGVGENLMDHVNSMRVYSTNSPDTLNIQVNSLFGYIKNGIRYYLTNKGPLTVGASIGGGYVTLMPGAEAPDLHFHFIPYRAGDMGWDLARGSGFRFGMYPNRPTSRGHVRITSARMEDQPEILFNHLDTEYDRQVLLAGLKFTTKVAQSRALAPFDLREVTPGVHTDDELLDHMRRTADTAFHFSGTARMGTDAMAAVDPALRVHGIQGLRVIDASVMPVVVSGNTNAATFMIGEKGADLIKADQK